MSRHDSFGALTFQLTSASPWSEVPPAANGPSADVVYDPLPRIDVVVQVGHRHFHAHRSVLSAHSGYFKNVLAGTTPAVEAGGRHPRGNEAQAATAFLAVPLPANSARPFATLLDFMYSAQLRLDVQNISEVLLCAQLLHMPQAVDICRSFLLQLQQHLGSEHLAAPLGATGPLLYPVCGSLQPYAAATTSTLESSVYGRGGASATVRPTLVRPIPTNRMPAFFSPYPSSFQQRQQRLLPANFPATFLGVAAADTTWNLERDSPCTFTSSRPPQADVREPSPGPEQRAIHQERTTGQSPLSSTPAGSPSSVSVLASETPSAATPQPVKLSADSEDVSLDESSCGSSIGGHSSNRADTADGTKSAGRVVTDIACCDGPVKFQRVLNENCTLVRMPDGECQKGSATARCQLEATSSDHTSHRRERSLRTRADRQRPTATIKERRLPQTGSADRSAACKDESPDGTGRSRGRARPAAFFCIYCKQTFKSRCCYTKHKWRHLNPSTLEGQSPATAVVREHHKPQARKQPSTAEVCRKQDVTKQEEEQSDKEAVGTDQPAGRKPLEINVPFYPCKVCGCRFPSYYFVHKHRRTWHREHEQTKVLEGEDGGGNSSTAADPDATTDCNDTGELIIDA